MFGVVSPGWNCLILIQMLSSQNPFEILTKHQLPLFKRDPRKAPTFCTVLYTTIKYWPAPPTIHRGLEWPQFLNSLIVLCLSACSLSVGKFSNFFVQYKAAGVRKNVVRMNTDVLI